ncbi:hypothetical protein MA16_Dca019211 [Dendrobium catenatum]|uniref:Uncharacterized protein n=1 Tax=Dendrobium catenatum TaxID=906689 RepID=A0A2I0WKE1_9ASPA|nr:hypothetical protein MA16_Dca019211 [Dendrobium catenatum]
MPIYGLCHSRKTINRALILHQGGSSEEREEEEKEKEKGEKEIPHLLDHRRRSSSCRLKASKLCRTFRKCQELAEERRRRGERGKGDSSPPRPPPKLFLPPEDAGTLPDFRETPGIHRNFVNSLEETNFEGEQIWIVNADPDVEVNKNRDGRVESNMDAVDADVSDVEMGIEWLEEENDGAEEGYSDSGEEKGGGGKQ